MKTKALLLIIAIAAAACADLSQKAAPPKHCDQGLCSVEITVLEGCRIQLPVPDPLHVPPGHHLIKWTLSSATPKQYGFSRNGIIFSSGPFTFPVPQLRLFTMNVQNPGGATTQHKYSINIVGGAEKCTLDPYVINDP